MKPSVLPGITLAYPPQNSRPVTVQESWPWKLSTTSENQPRPPGFRASWEERPPKEPIGSWRWSSSAAIGEMAERAATTAQTVRDILHSLRGPASQGRARVSVLEAGGCVHPICRPDRVFVGAGRLAASLRAS